MIKAIAIYPGKPHSMHLEEIPMPKVTDIPHGRGVLVKVLRVGVDGTDKEINAAEYGNAPEGETFLITGHENFGQVVEVGPDVPDTIKPGNYVVATVRRPGHSAERLRLAEAHEHTKPWYRWGPYLSERQWGTVREDYSPYGNAWDSFPHDHARSRAYRWGEDGLLGISD